MNYRLILSGTVALVMTGPVQAASVFSDRAAFEGAVGASSTETFDDPIATDTSITFENGTTATKSSDGVPPTLNTVQNGRYVGFVKKDGFRTITFDFGAGITGFGADFSDMPNDTVDSLFVTGMFDGVSETFSVVDNRGADGFFGITGSTAFSSVTFTTESGSVLFPGGTPFGGETFYVDNLTTAGAPPAIPLPAGGLLLLTGLAGLGLARRRLAA